MFLVRHYSSDEVSELRKENEQLKQLMAELSLKNSESTVYRILKAHDLVTSPVYMVISALDKFPYPTKAPNELWQTDFTWFKVVHWGWYYLCTILDDCSRYILSWQLCTGMSTEDVKQTSVILYDHLMTCFSLLPPN
jgi:transposase InsO family protein